MQLIRFVSTDPAKGTKNYLKTQRVYELVRTLVYFAISASLFAAGWITTGNRVNLLTIVAVLGCLPASKSAVECIMFFRYKSCDKTTVLKIEEHTEGLMGLFDMVFTSGSANFRIDHISVKGNTICAYTADKGMDEQAFYRHLNGCLSKDGFQDVSIKLFTDLSRYTDRLDQMRELDTNEKNTLPILATLKSIAL